MQILLQTSTAAYFPIVILVKTSGGKIKNEKLVPVVPPLSWSWNSPLLFGVAPSVPFSHFPDSASPGCIGTRSDMLRGAPVPSFFTPPSSRPCWWQRFGSSRLAGTTWRTGYTAECRLPCELFWSQNHDFFLPLLRYLIPTILRNNWASFCCPKVEFNLI